MLKRSTSFQRSTMQFRRVGRRYVGGGTGMVAHGFKGAREHHRVCCNRGRRLHCGRARAGKLRAARSVSCCRSAVGQEITDLLPESGKSDDGQGSSSSSSQRTRRFFTHQLKRLVKRVSLAVGMMGGRGEDSSATLHCIFDG